MTALEIILISLYAVLLGIGGWRLGVYKGYPWSGAAGAVAGLVLGLLGILVMVLIPSSPAAKAQRDRDRRHAERLAREAERLIRDGERAVLSGQRRAG